MEISQLEKIRFSIIIPVYNVAPYIEACVESILCQTFSDFEIILVDDGSTDESGVICDRYKEQDERISVIHKTNGGLSDARNVGVNAAKGEFLVFLDSDDFWLDISGLEGIDKLINETKSDVVAYGRRVLNEKTGEIKDWSVMPDICRIKSQDKTESMRYMIDSALYISSACSKVVRRETIIKNNLLFEKGATSEDILWSAKLAVYLKNIDYYTSNLYVYRQRQGSITKTMSIKNIVQLIKNIEACIEFSELILDKRFYSVYMGYVSYQYITLLANSYKLTHAERKEVWEDIIALKYLLDYGNNHKIKKIRRVKRMIGFNLMYLILKVFYTKIKRRRTA